MFLVVRNVQFIFVLRLQPAADATAQPPQGWAPTVPLTGSWCLERPLHHPLPARISHLSAS